MPFLSNLWWLLVAHALTDYALQSDRMGEAKAPGHGHDPSLGPWWWSMLAHALLNGGGVAIATQSIPLGVAETLVHFLTDTWKCVALDHTALLPAPPPWLQVVTWIDQSIHLLSKCLWACLAS